jgi:hypothetical protein
MRWQAMSEFYRTATQEQINTALIWQWLFMGLFVVGLLAYSYCKTEWADKSE